MAKLDEYKRQLRELTDWTPFLLKNSGLPGPRGNLELAQAFAEMASPALVEEYLAIPAEEAPENSARVYLIFCGVTTLGKMAARGEHRQLARLRRFASDSRWRVREAVAIALQYVGDASMPLLLEEMEQWVAGNWYEKRAVAAALAEPRLLKDRAPARRVLHLFDRITSDMASAANRGEESFSVLRKSMGYCWSVAVAALPTAGKLQMEKWLDSSDPDIRWIMKENLKKNRLVRMDDRWVDSWQDKLQRSG